MKAIVFDLDDTLIVEEATAHGALGEALGAVAGIGQPDAVNTALSCARRHWQASEHNELCLRLGIASWEGLWATFAGGHPCLSGLAAWVPHYRNLAWSDTLVALGSDPTLASAVSAHYIEAQRRGHPVIPSAIAALRSVKEASTAVLTNGPPDIQRLKLAQAGIDTAFDAIVISGEVGVGKPDPAVFSLTLDLLGVSPAYAVMIGDSWDRDILGALNAGMRAVWIGRGRQPARPLENVVVLDELTPETLIAL